MSATTEPQAKKAKMSSLDQLKSFTTIVADTGDFEGNYTHPEFPFNSLFQLDSA